MPGADPNSAPLRSEKTKTELGRADRWSTVQSWIASTLRWHLLAFIAVNAILTVANVALEGGWWAFWPLLISAAMLSVHYLFCKALIVSDGWVDERVEELNIKSYDRAHIDELKTRLGPAAMDGRAHADDPPRGRRQPTR
jgi:2TM domain